MHKLAILAILFLALLISACNSQERDGYQPSYHVKQTTPVWKWKTIMAEYKETKGSEIIVYDAEDDMTFVYRLQDIGLGKYINLKNLPSGAKVHIEVNSLVDESTGEILKRQSYKIWL